MLRFPLSAAVAPLAARAIPKCFVGLSGDVGELLSSSVSYERGRSNGDEGLVLNLSQFL